MEFVLRMNRDPGVWERCSARLTRADDRRKGAIEFNDNVIRLKSAFVTPAPLHRRRYEIHATAREAPWRAHAKIDVRDHCH